MKDNILKEIIIMNIRHTRKDHEREREKGTNQRDDMRYSRMNKTKYFSR
jgi:hypothetical protein